SFLCPSIIHSRKNASYWSKGKNQCLVDFNTGVEPVIVDFGLIKSVAFNEVPHFSHWSPYAPSLLHFGQVPVTKRSAKNCSASASYNCSVTSSINLPSSYNFRKNSEAVS